MNGRLELGPLSSVTEGAATATAGPAYTAANATTTTPSAAVIDARIGLFYRRPSAETGEDERVLVADIEAVKDGKADDDASAEPVDD